MGEGLGDRLQQWLAGRLADAEAARDRGGDQFGIGDRREPDEVHGALGRRGRGSLECEPALACASGPGDGDEPHVAPIEELADPREVVPPADEAMVECR